MRSDDDIRNALATALPAIDAEQAWSDLLPRLQRQRRRRSVRRWAVGAGVATVAGAVLVNVTRGDDPRLDTGPVAPAPSTETTPSSTPSSDATTPTTTASPAEQQRWEILPIGLNRSDLPTLAFEWTGSQLVLVNPNSTLLVELNGERAELESPPDRKSVV